MKEKCHNFDFSIMAVQTELPTCAGLTSAGCQPPRQLLAHCPSSAADLVIRLRNRLDSL